MKVVASYNIKGGVGKTASAVNLAYLAAAEGISTLVWDLDPQGAATFYFRVKPKVKGGAKKLLRGKTDPDKRIRATDFENLHLLPADFSYRHMDLALDATAKPGRTLARLVRPLASEYELLILDCPPSISLVSESVFAAADELLVPTIPTPLSLRTLKQLRRHLRKRGPKRLGLLPFLCMVDRRKKLHREIVAAAAGDPAILDTVIPYSSTVERMGTERAPLAVFAASSPAARAYSALWGEVGERLFG